MTAGTFGSTGPNPLQPHAYEGTGATCERCGNTLFAPAHQVADQKGELESLRARVAELERMYETSHKAHMDAVRACAELNAEVSQILGKALGYLWFKDDRKNFPDATEADGVCVGDHVAETLAEEAAKKIGQALAENAQYRDALQRAAGAFRHYTELHMAKGTADGEIKANANRHLAEQMEAALADKGGGDADG